MNIDHSRQYTIDYSPESGHSIIATYGNVSVTIPPVHEEHSQTRRARARRYVKELLGSEWDIHEYRGICYYSSTLGKLHSYSAIRIP